MHCLSYLGAIFDFQERQAIFSSSSIDLTQRRLCLRERSQSQNGFQETLRHILGTIFILFFFLENGLDFSSIPNVSYSKLRIFLENVDEYMFLQTQNLSRYDSIFLKEKQ